MEPGLRERRGELERSWAHGVVEAAPSSARPEVRSSWERSAAAVDPALAAAPVREPGEVARAWADSEFGRAAATVLDDLRDMAAAGDMMAAVTDESVTIAWASGGPTMARRADEVHFSPGGCWAEEAVGTNALALARQNTRPSTCFSAEHFAPMVHDWVCYSAPITDPATGRFLGVIDVSTAWDRAHPALLTTVSALARCVEHELGAARRAGPTPPAGIAEPGEATMELRTLGGPQLRLGRDVVAATRRQLELLTILSLHPDGLSLDELTGRVYGDHPVSPSTVKAELSHLRHLLGGRIASRPYRLVGPVDADHHRLLDALAAGDTATAVGLYRGPLFGASDSPEIESWRRHIDVSVREAALASGQADLLYQLGSHCEDDEELQAAALAALAPGDSRRCIVAGRLAAARPA